MKLPRPGLFVLLLICGCAPTLAPLPTLVPTAAALIPRQATWTPTATALPTEPATITIAPTATPTPADTATPLPTPTAIPSTTPIPTLAATATSLSPTEIPPPTPTETPIPTATATTAPVAPLPSVNASPGSPQPYLSRYRLVAYYGSAWYQGGLGILDDYSRDEVLRQLRGLAAQYQPLSEQHVLPTFHMVTTVANQYPPLYRHHVDLEQLQSWVETANASDAAIVLDIQPGLADVIAEVERVKPLLYNPHVHLALDPEFAIVEGQVPGVNLGKMNGEQINQVQAILNEIAIEIGVNRVLIVHQFVDRMLESKELIADYPHVELIIDSDGAFNTAVKVGSYIRYASEPGFEYGGIKFFYEHDDYILEPGGVMELLPPPALIIYQ